MAPIKISVQVNFEVHLYIYYDVDKVREQKKLEATLRQMHDCREAAVPSVQCTIGVGVV